MDVKNCRGKLATHSTDLEPNLIILHHTVSPTVSSAVNGLKSRAGGLGYHFIIDNDGTVNQFGDCNQLMYHASGYNHESIGVSFVGGGHFSSVNAIQIKAAIRLINENIKTVCPSISLITCHKHATSSGKIDPRFPGEPENGINLIIDKHYMDQISQAVGLTFVGHGEI